MKKVIAIIAVMFGISMFAYANLNQDTIVADAQTVLNAVPTTSPELHSTDNAAVATDSSYDDDSMPADDTSGDDAGSIGIAPDSDLEGEQGIDDPTDSSDLY